MTSLHCGIDYHKNTCTICLLNNEKKSKEIAKIKTINLFKFLSNFNIHSIAIEASGGVNEVVEKLKSSGYMVVLVNPTAFRLIGMNGKKTDKKDATLFAEALAAGMLPRVHHKSRSSRELKSLIMARESIVRARVNFSNIIRGLLREYGITINVGKENFINDVKEKIDQIE